MALKKNTPKGVEKPRVQAPTLHADAITNLTVVVRKEPTAAPAESIGVEVADLAVEPSDWPRTAEAKAKLITLRRERRDVEAMLSKEGHASPLAGGLRYRQDRLDEEINECLATLEQLEVERRLAAFEPCVDVQQAFVNMVSERLKSHFGYLENIVDDLDQQILCQAIETLKRQNGIEGGWLQPGEFIEAILFVLGAGKTAEVPK